MQLETLFVLFCLIAVIVFEYKKDQKQENRIKESEEAIERLIEDYDANTDAIEDLTETIKKMKEIKDK